MKFIAVFFLLLVGSQSFANPESKNKQNNIVDSFKIVVVDALTEEPIPAATIKIDQIDLETYTDFDGFVEIRGISYGDYSIEISFISYKTKQIETYKIDEHNNTLLIKL